MSNRRNRWNRSMRSNPLSRGLLCRGLVLAAALAGCAGCADRGDNGGERIELLVSAAASLQSSMEEVEASYEELHPGVDLLLNYGSSGALQKQIEQGAPADLFLSAGMKQVEALEEAGLLRDSERLLGNTLVALVSDEAAAHVGSLDDLLGEAVRKIAIGDPDLVPAGLYARETLTNAGLWDAVGPKLVLAKDVRQVTTYVESGNAELGLVYKTDAVAAEKARVAFEIDPGLHSPIVYPAAVTTESRHPEEAERLLDFLKGEEARAIFEEQGFAALQP